MPRYIVKLADKYLEWSTVVDAPVTLGMSREAFQAYYLNLYGTKAKAELEERLERVDKKGLSARNGWTIEDLIRSNRAGPHETRMTEEEIIEAWCR